MAGFQERTGAAVHVITSSVNESWSIVRKTARIAVDPRAGAVAHINAPFFTVSVLAGTVPLAVGEAVAAFIKPPKSPATSA